MVSIKDDEPPRDVSFDEESNCTIEEVMPHKQSVKQILLLAFSSLGAIYGDIGTSPLYVMNSIKYPHDLPTHDDIYGAVSVIFWLFVLLVLAKYALIVLTYGPNNGEGGQVAIYAKIARSLKFGPKGVIIPGTPEKSDLELLKRTETTLSFLSMHNEKTWKKNPAVLRFISFFTLCTCFLGCALVMSDGLLTPTTSVLSAIAGIQVAKPDFSHVLPVSEAVLVVLFVIQQFGSHYISLLFAPIVFLWMVGLVICGVINITLHPAIFKSLSPYYAIQLLKGSGIDALGGAMLAITGTEAMFADLGHFGKLPTQIGITSVFICLMIAYLGQGAYLIKHPEDVASVFYLSIPGGVNSWSYWVMFVLATLSTVIASQALILGVFSILSQMINLDCFPKLKVKHVSASYVGKVYIPVANLLLLIGVCATTAGFKNSNNVTAAYGLGISLDFVLTTLLMMICMVYVFEFNILIPIVFGAIFLPLEMCLVVANIKKVPHGAWFPLMMCAFFFSFFVFWRYCRDKAVSQQLKARVRLADLYPNFKRHPTAEVVDLRGRPTAVESVHSVDLEPRDITENIVSPVAPSKDAFQVLRSRYGNTDIKVHPGVAIIYSDTPHQDLASPNTVPGVYSRIVSDFASIPSVVIFCTIRVLSIPSVPYEERVMVGFTKIPGHYKCVLRFGFMENVVVDRDLQDHILDLFGEVDSLRRANPEVRILHVFENNKIRSHAYMESEYATKNPYTLVTRFLRKFIINQIFSPLNAVFQYNDLYVEIDNEDEEQKDKVFIGGVMRI